MTNFARLFHIAAAALAALVLCVPAHAGVTIYSDRAAWLAATTGVSNIDFESLAGDGTGLGSSLTLSGVTFTATNNYLITLGPVSTGYDIGSGKYLQGPFDIFQGPQRFTFAAFGSHPSSVGTDLGSYTGDPGFFEVLVHTSLSGDVLGTSSAAYRTRSFLGFTTDVPGDSILSFRVHTFGTGRPNTLLDNVAFGTAAPIPLPAAWVLLLWGLGFLGVRMRNRAA